MNRVIAAAFGLVMVAAAAVQADSTALMVAAAAALAVLVSMLLRIAATLAVLLAGAVIVLADTPPMLTAMCGLSAAGYLVLRHTTIATGPTVIGAVGFTAAGLAAVALPMQLPWVPVVAPVAVLTLVVLVTRPFWADQKYSRK